MSLLLRTTLLLRCKRTFATTAALSSRKNPRKRPKTILDVPEHMRPIFEGKLDYELPPGMKGTGERPVGVKLHSGEFVKVPEMIPELVVPDLKDFHLKAYVSYRTPNIEAPEPTARDLFDHIYGKQIYNDFNAGKLKEEAAEVLARAERGELSKPSYDVEPPRMLDSSKVPVV